MPRKNSKPTKEQASLDACLQRRGIKLSKADLHAARKQRKWARSVEGRECARLSLGADLEW